MLAEACGLVDQVLCGKLRELSEGTVHSVFANTVNIESNGILVTLQNPTEDYVPCSVVLRERMHWPLHCSPGQVVFLSNEALVLPQLRIVLAASPLPSGYVPSAGGAAAQELALPVKVLRELLRKRRVEALPSDGFQEHLQAEMQRRQDALLAAFADGGIEAAVSRLLGFGLGLTPAGDDYLAGLLLTLHWRYGQADPLVETLGRAVAALLPRTTRIAAGMLLHAANGFCRVSLAALIASCHSGCADTIRRAADRLMIVGASSGRDMCGGVLDGLTFSAKENNGHV